MINNHGHYHNVAVTIKLTSINNSITLRRQCWYLSKLDITIICRQRCSSTFVIITYFHFSELIIK